MTLIKDLIAIPEQVQKGDFVLRLAEGVNRAEETLHDYVVTPELKECFDNALTFLRSALQTNTSKGDHSKPGAKYAWEYILDSYGMENTLTDEGS